MENQMARKQTGLEERGSKTPGRGGLKAAAPKQAVLINLDDPDSLQTYSSQERGDQEGFHASQERGDNDGDVVDNVADLAGSQTSRASQTSSDSSNILAKRKLHRSKYQQAALEFQASQKKKRRKRVVLQEFQKVRQHVDEFFAKRLTSPMNTFNNRSKFWWALQFEKPTIDDPFFWEVFDDNEQEVRKYL